MVWNVGQRQTESGKSVLDYCGLEGKTESIPQEIVKFLNFTCVPDNRGKTDVQ